MVPMIMNPSRFSTGIVIADPTYSFDFSTDPSAASSFSVSDGDSGWANGGGGMSYWLNNPDRTVYVDGGAPKDSTNVSVSFTMHRDWVSWMYMRIDMVTSSGTTTVVDSGRGGDGDLTKTYSNSSVTGLIGFKMFSRASGGGNKKHKINYWNVTYAKAYKYNVNTSYSEITYTGDELKHTADSGTSQSGGSLAYFPVGGTLGTKFVVRYKNSPSGTQSYNANSHILCGLASEEPTGTGHIGTTDWIGTRWYFGSQWGDSANKQGFEPRIQHNTTSGGHNNATGVDRLYGRPNEGSNAGGDFYTELIWNSGVLTFNLYDNPEYADTPLSTAVLSSTSNTQWTAGDPDSIGPSFKYFCFYQANDHQLGDFSILLDDVKIWDNVTSVTPIESLYSTDFTGSSSHTGNGPSNTQDGWTTNDYNYSKIDGGNDRLDFSSRGDGTNDSVTYDLGSALSDTKWVIRFELTFTTLSHSGLAPGVDRNECNFGMFSSDYSSGFTASQDSLGFQLHIDRDGTYRYYVHNTDGSGLTGYTSGQRNDNFTTTTYYFEMVRKSSTSMSIKAYTDNTYTTQIGGDFSSNVTVPSTVTGLRYFGFKNSDNYNYGGNGSGYISNVEIWDGVDSAV